MSKKHKKVFTNLNYIEHFLILASTVTKCTVTKCISISAFASLLGILIGITSSAIGLRICAISAGIKTYKLIIKKKEKRHEIVLAKAQLNSI